MPTRRALFLAVLAFVVGSCAATEGVRPEPGAATTSTTERTTTTTTSLAPSAYGGTVVVGLADGGVPRTLNPLLDGPDTAVLDLIGPAVFARGYDVDPETMALVPNVLQKIPSISDGTVVDLGDGTIQVTAAVADGARWSDGAPITGEDLSFTVRLASDATLPIRSDAARRYGLIDTTSLEVSGRSLTFRMQASTDYQLLFDVIVPRHQVEGTDFATSWNSTMWVGAGPFTFGSWTPGQALELTRNDAYWRSGPDDAPLPYLDRIIIRFYEPGPSLDPRVVEGLGSGEIDVVSFADTAGMIDQLGDLGDAVLISGPGLRWEYLNFQFGPANRNDQSLNEYVKFRRAVASAIDRETLAGDRGDRPLFGMLTQYGPEYRSTPWDRFPFDPGRTATLLGELGTDLGVDLTLGSGPPVVVTVPSDDARVAAVGGQVVTMLRSAGFDARLQLEAPTDFYGATTENGSWDVSIGTFTAGPGVARTVALMGIFDPEGLPFVGANFFRWGTIDSTVSGPEVDDYRSLVARLRVESDPDAAAGLVADAEAILAGQMVIVPLTTADRPGVAFRPTALVGPGLNPGEGLMWNVGEWTRAVPTEEGSAP